MSTSNISEGDNNQDQQQLSISNRATHDKKYPFLNDISQLLQLYLKSMHKEFKSEKQIKTLLNQVIEAKQL